MATLLTYDLDDVANNTTLTTGITGSGDTAPTTVNGAPTSQNTDLPLGASDNNGMTFTQSGSQSSVKFAFGASRTDARMRVYFKTPSAWPSSALATILLFQSASARRAGLGLAGSGAPGTLRVYGNGTTFTAPADNTFALNTWYRVEMGLHITSSTVATVDIDVFPVGSNTALWSQSITVNPAGTTFDSVTFGETAATPVVTLKAAHLKVTDVYNTTIGEWVPPTPPGPTTTILVSGAEVPAATSIKVGGVEVPATLTIT